MFLFDAIDVLLLANGHVDKSLLPSIPLVPESHDLIPAEEVVYSNMRWLFEYLLPLLLWF